MLKSEMTMATRNARAVSHHELEKSVWVKRSLSTDVSETFSLLSDDALSKFTKVTVIKAREDV